MILLLIVTVVVVSSLIRLITIPFRHSRRMARGYGRGYNPYRYGCRRHHRLLGGVLPILALVAFDRLFTRRF